MNGYGIEYKKIESIDEIKQTHHKIHYNYNSIDFLYTKKYNTKNILVSFHGHVGIDRPLPIFRGYNWDIPDTNILCISDPLLNYYRDDGLVIGWFLSTKKYPVFDTYREILSKVLEEYDNVIFYGSSAGGYPSLIFASYFNQTCIIANSQIYLNKYVYYDKFINILTKNNDTVLYKHIEKYMLKHNFPKKVIMFCNKNDKHHYNTHMLPLYNFINLHKPNVVEPNFFIGEKPADGKKDHSILYPENMTITDIVLSYI